MFTHMYSTQIPHAVGAAYSLKMDKKDACAVTYFGDGGSSEVIVQFLFGSSTKESFRGSII